MRKPLVVLGLTVAGLLLSGLPADACGDKLLVLGRGVRFQVETADYPAAILLYMNPNSPGAAAVSDSQLQGILRDAGHRLHSVKSPKEIGEALKTGRYDIVLADLTDAPGLEGMVRAAASHPVLLPFVYKGSKADFSSAKQRYLCALKAPASVGHFLDTIDRTMESRAKQARARAKALPAT